MARIMTSEKNVIKGGRGESAAWHRGLPQTAAEGPQRCRSGAATQGSLRRHSNAVRKDSMRYQCDNERGSVRELSTNKKAN